MTTREGQPHIAAKLLIGDEQTDCRFLRFISDSAVVVADIDPPIGAAAILQLALDEKPLELHCVVGGSTGDAPFTIELEVNELSDAARGALRKMIRRASGEYVLPAPRIHGLAAGGGTPRSTRSRTRYARDKVSAPSIAVCLGRRLLTLHQMAGQTTHIGRGNECEIRVNNITVSRHHCRIELVDGDYWLEDDGASNRTLLNGKPVLRERLQRGDEIHVGKYIVLFAPSDKQLPSRDIGAKVQSLVARADAGTEDAASASSPSLPSALDERTYALDPGEYQRVLSKLHSERRAHLKVVRQVEVGEPIVLASKRTVLGRGRLADVLLEGWWRVRKEHAVIVGVATATQERHTIEVLGGGKPVLVSGKRIRRRATLANEDLIEIGANQFRYYASVSRTK